MFDAFNVFGVFDVFNVLTCLMCLQKKSREESEGKESGVEILINEPYTDGPGGSGQYTRKIYHIGSHLPGVSSVLVLSSDVHVRVTAVKMLNINK